MNSERANKSVRSPQHSFTDVSTELLRSGQGIRFRAPGRSMYPTIKEHETITVQPVAPSRIKRGDIILYRWEQGVIAHRVVRIERGAHGGSCFILRGDASGAPDEPVEQAQVLGKVVSVERDGRSIDLNNGVKSLFLMISFLYRIYRRGKGLFIKNKDLTPKN